MYGTFQAIKGLYIHWHLFFIAISFKVRALMIPHFTDEEAEPQSY